MLMEATLIRLTGTVVDVALGLWSKELDPTGSLTLIFAARCFRQASSITSRYRYCNRIELKQALKVQYQ